MAANYAGFSVPGLESGASRSARIGARSPARARARSPACSVQRLLGACLGPADERRIKTCQKEIPKNSVRRALTRFLLPLPLSRALPQAVRSSCLTAVGTTAQVRFDLASQLPCMQTGAWRLRTNPCLGPCKPARCFQALAGIHHVACLPALLGTAANTRVLMRQKTFHPFVIGTAILKPRRGARDGFLH